MDAQKAWVRVSYECSYDVQSGGVVAVNVRAGRLDQPLSNVDSGAAGAIPARVIPQGLPQQQASAQPPPAAGRHQRQRVWEPSPVEIQQQSPNPRR